MFPAWCEAMVNVSVLVVRKRVGNFEETGRVAESDIKPCLREKPQVTSAPKRPATYLDRLF